MNIRHPESAASANAAVPAADQGLRLPAWFSVVSLVLAAALLFGFYHVIQQAVARAHMHWERAPAARTAAVDSCITAPSASLLHGCGQLR